MKKIFLPLLVLAIMAFTSTPPKPAYRIFDKNGKTITYEAMLESLQKTDVTLFGELHNNPISHWLELQVTKDLHKAYQNKLVLGAEMFEADNQLLLDEYLNGTTREKNFEEEAKLWNNYKTDYKPLLTFAKEKELQFVATNIPRRYASLVFHEGIEALDSLSLTAKTYLAPLPIPIDLELPGYKAMMEMMGEGHEGENFPKAQAVKDATMAHFITQNWSKSKHFLHYNGTYHSDNFEGITWYLKKYRPSINYHTISTVEQSNIDNLDTEHLGKANFVIVIPSDMCKTY